MGPLVDPPEPRLAHICQAGAELKAQQPKQPKDDVGVASGVRDQLLWLQLSLLLQEALQEVRRLFQGPRNDDAVEARELVAHEVVIGDATLHVEVLAVVSRV